MKLARDRIEVFTRVLRHQVGKKLGHPEYTVP